ncbi:uncharacterized protein LOC111713737 [Eurytemora carolleeae]|uniref:uncharacterized protein LOC111713737 n=1 Tax=Eurytemora carolleeae TaxID=1294199 RepID=UPI000C778C63|nr:uncharacterized protein LOC111713737 [Eurytemora carolleeae]|eukprot:XP_023344445.1 uncharacterized protein LOC111713737 [Eurytemora affinis]
MISLVFTVMLMISWFFARNTDHTQFLVSICKRQHQNGVDPGRFFKRRLKNAIFVSFFFFGIFSTHYRIKKLVRKNFRGSLKKVGLRYQRNIVTYRQCYTFTIHLLVSRLVREGMELLLYNNQDLTSTWGMQIFFCFYIIKEVAVTIRFIEFYLTSHKYYLDIQTQENVDEGRDILSLLGMIHHLFPKPNQTMYLR